jgi:UrcA family protein
MNTTNIATRFIAGALFTALVSSFNAIASAEDSGKAVKYTEVSVSTSQGAASLYNHIVSAAAEVCAPLAHGDLASRMSKNACMQKAIVDAVSQVNQPALTAVYNARNSSSLPIVAAK